MAVYYLDSSAVVKRYVHEVELGALTGHTWMQQLCVTAASNKDVLVISQLALVEVVSTFHKKARGNRVNTKELTRILDDFTADCQADYAIQPVTIATFDRAGALIRTHGQKRGIRSLDAIQLSGCLALRDVARAVGASAPTFVCSDDALLHLAGIEGLRTENPNLYA
jgi:predicted nucleic acid-binding protein